MGEVENECSSHKLILLFAIFVPKIFTVGGNLTMFWQKWFCTVFFETRCSFSLWYGNRQCNGPWLIVHALQYQSRLKRHQINSSGPIGHHHTTTTFRTSAVTVLLCYRDAQYTPPMPTRLNCRVESLRQCVLNSQLVGDCLDGSQQIYRRNSTHLADSVSKFTRPEPGWLLRLRVQHSARAVYTGWHKNWHIFLYALTLPNTDRFSQLFQCQNQEKIWNNTINKDPITARVATLPCEMSVS